jgi:hypothetical protein
MGKGKRAGSRGGGGGLVCGKLGAKKKMLEKKQGVSHHTTKVERGFAKKAKRRALRAVPVPEEFKSQSKKKNKKVLVQAAIANAEVLQCDANTHQELLTLCAPGRSFGRGGGSCGTDERRHHGDLSQSKLARPASSLPVFVVVACASEE